jgi:hypothetical protein
VKKSAYCKNEGEKTTGEEIEPIVYYYGNNQIESEEKVYRNTKKHPMGTQYQLTICITNLLQEPSRSRQYYVESSRIPTQGDGLIYAHSKKKVEAYTLHIW